MERFEVDENCAEGDALRLIKIEIAMDLILCAVFCGTGRTAAANFDVSYPLGMCANMPCHTGRLHT